MNIYVIGSDVRGLFGKIKELATKHEDVVIFPPEFYKKQNLQYIQNKFIKLSATLNGLFVFYYFDKVSSLLLFYNGTFLGKHEYKEMNCIKFENFVFVLDENILNYKSYDKMLNKECRTLFLLRDPFCEKFIEKIKMQDRKFCIITKDNNIFTSNNIKIIKNNKNVTQYNVQ